MLVCKHCGHSFKTKNINKIYCSQECQEACCNKRYNQKRQQQLKNNFKEKVTIKMLHERDKGICQICGKPVELKNKANAYWDATIDHIMPLSKGGEHSMKNCQLTHRICNSLKSDTSSYNAPRPVIISVNLVFQDRCPLTREFSQN